MLVFTSTWNSSYKLPHSTVAVLVYRNCSKVANLKWSKLGNFHLLSSPASLVEHEKCCIRNSHPYVGNSQRMIILSFFLSIISTYLVRFLQGRPRGQSVLAVGSHSSVHMLGWRINRKYMGGTRNNFYWKKSTNKNLLKDFLQKSKRCRDGRWSYWLTKFTYKEWRYYWLTKCINKNHNVWLYVSHMQPSLHK